jgi:hypothetical protein
MKHYMCDLETLDTAATAVVTAIGLVEFDPHSTRIGPTFYRVPNDLREQAKRGCTTNPETAVWWMRQSEAARNAITNPTEVSALPTRKCLEDLTAYLGGFGWDTCIWGNGADFDNLILGHLFGAFGMLRPWSYSANRCYRTMKNLPQAPKPARTGTHHNALDDAVSQAIHLQEIYACLKLQ